MPSYSGISATLLLVILTIAYGAINFIELSNHGKSTIRLDVIDYHYSDSDIFDLDKTNGLNIAFGITHYDNNPDPIDNLYYGEVVALLKRWDGNSGAWYEKLNLRPCT